MVVRGSEREHWCNMNEERSVDITRNHHLTRHFNPADEKRAIAKWASVHLNRSRRRRSAPLYTWYGAHKLWSDFPIVTFFMLHFIRSVESSHRSEPQCSTEKCNNWMRAAFYIFQSRWCSKHKRFGCVFVSFSWNRIKSGEPMNEGCMWIIYDTNTHTQHT